MTTKASNPIQTIKLLVMLNSLLILTVIFLAFFNPIKLTNLATATGIVTANQPIAATEFQPVNAVASPQSADTIAVNSTGSTTDELTGLPYVSRNGLAQQAAVQVVSYQRQPRVKARSSR